MTQINFSIPYSSILQAVEGPPSPRTVSLIRALEAGACSSATAHLWSALHDRASRRVTVLATVLIHVSLACSVEAWVEAQRGWMRGTLTLTRRLGRLSAKYCLMRPLLERLCNNHRAQRLRSQQACDTVYVEQSSLPPGNRSGLMRLRQKSGRTGDACSRYTAKHLKTNLTHFAMQRKNKKDRFPMALKEAYAATDASFLEAAQRSGEMAGSTAVCGQDAETKEAEEGKAGFASQFSKAAQEEEEKEDVALVEAILAADEVVKEEKKGIDGKHPGVSRVATPMDTGGGVVGMDLDAGDRHHTRCGVSKSKSGRRHDPLVYFLPRQNRQDPAPTQ